MSGLAASRVLARAQFATSANIRVNEWMSHSSSGAVNQGLWSPEQEFWWLPSGIVAGELFCRFANTDAPDEAGNIPGIRLASSWSTDESAAQLLRVAYADKCWQHWDGVNIHRSLTVHYELVRQHTIKGPFLLDIDGSEEQPYEVRVEDARRLALRVVDCRRDEFQVARADLRCHFSGSKGFHIEVRPTALRPTQRRDDAERRIRTRLKVLTRETTGPSTSIFDGRPFIDPPHRYVRLANSINSWWEHGKLRFARRTRVTLEALRSLPIQDILGRAQHRAE